jgi:hypothetical protein
MTESTTLNPYSPPAAKLTDENDVIARAEQVRRSTLRHEMGVKSVGELFIFGALVIMIPAVYFGGFGDFLALRTLPRMVGATAIACIGIGLGYGLRTLQGWARIPGAIASALGMLVFPFGTIINGYFVYLLLCKKGRFAFSDEYAHVRSLTPHVKYRPVAATVVLIAFVLLVAVAIVVPLLHTVP